MKRMRLRIRNKYIIIGVCCLLQACSVTKNVPEGQYFLNNVTVTSDTKEVRVAELEEYIKQHPNAWKNSARLYNLGDTTNWLKRMIRKAGKAPVLFNPRAMEQSVKEMQIELVNRGYLHARVEAVTDTVSPKKMEINYRIKANQPYHVRNYAIEVNDARAQSYVDLWNQRRQEKIKSGTVFDYRILEEERTGTSKFLRNVGYYTFSTDNLYYLADTTLRSNQVDLTLTLRDTAGFKPYYINKVRVLSGFDPITNRRFRAVDSTSHKGVDILYDNSRFIRPHVMVENITLRPGQVYSEWRSQQTYEMLTALSAVSKAGVEFREVQINDTTALDCDIYLSPGDIHGVELGLDGTHNAGDLGVAANIAYTHGNIFNGSEVLSVKLRGAYEFVNAKSNDDFITNNYYEWGIGSSLRFPKIIFPFFSHNIKQRMRADTEFGISFDTQNRKEYTRNFLNLSWRYKWENIRKNLQHSLSILNVNFVSMPYKSQEFQDYINKEENYLTRISYDNLFTAGAGYQGSYSNEAKQKYQTRLYTLRYGIESSGNVMNGLFSLINADKNEDQQYHIMGNPFAQYIKVDVDFAQTYWLNERNALALHAAAGVAYAYGNSKILPFEKRYYGGGPNNVRGWNTRELGPGAYPGVNDISVQNGDMNLLFNVEYRHKIIPMLEFAVFADAGNVWTLRDYENQPGGRFHWNTFLEEMAIGTGLGLRVDLSFLVIRIDGGKKAYDPVKKDSNPWVLFDKMKGNSAFYFAIGYPF